MMPVSEGGHERLSPLVLSLMLVGFMAPLDGAIIIPGLGSLPKIATAAALALTLVTIAQRKSIRCTGGLGKLLMLHICWLGTSLLWTTDPTAAMTGFNLVVQLAVLSFVIVQGLTAQRHRNAFAAAFGLGSVVAAMLVVSHWSTRAVYQDTDLVTLATKANVGEVARYTTGAEDPNHVAVLLVLGIVFLLGVVARSRSIAVRFAAIIAACFVYFAALLTGSRGSAVLTPVVVALYLATRVMHRRGRVLFAVVGLGLVGAAGWRFVPENTRVRLETSFDSKTSTAQLRERLWRASADAIKDRPVEGYGLRSATQVLQPRIGRPLAPHNTFLAVLLEGGAVDAVLVGSMVALILVQSRSLARQRRTLVCSAMLTVGVGAMFIGLDQKKVVFLVLAFAVAETADRRRSAPSPVTDDTTRQALLLTLGRHGQSGFDVEPINAGSRFTPVDPRSVR